MFEYYPPSFRGERFHCPYCHAYAAHHWTDDGLEADTDRFSTNSVCIDQEVVYISFSSCCFNPTFWCNEKIIYPPTRTAPPAHGDLPDDVKQVYEEAAAIANQSPRAACALLRLAVEMLMKHLGETGGINDSIRNLVEKGLNPEIQQALDIVRVTGNHAVHPGEIAFDDTTNVHAIFELINIIADELITRPEKLQSLHDKLPKKDKENITKRNGKTQ